MFIAYILNRNKNGKHLKITVPHSILFWKLFYKVQSQTSLVELCGRILFSKIKRNAQQVWAEHRLPFCTVTCHRSNQPQDWMLFESEFA